MFDDCQDSYQHCIMKAEGENNTGPRASIVFKKSIPQAGGRRGHGVTRQGGHETKRHGETKPKEQKPSVRSSESSKARNA